MIGEELGRRYSRRDMVEDLAALGLEIRPDRVGAWERGEAEPPGLQGTARRLLLYVRLQGGRPTDPPRSLWEALPRSMRPRRDTEGGE